MKTITIKKFDIMSLAKISAALNAFFGFIFGAIMTLISLAASGTIGVGAMFGAGAIIILPIVYGIMGFIGGLIMGWAFNVVAPRVGGLSFKVEESTPEPSVASTME